MKKFLLLTDLHYRLPWYQWLLHRGPDFDLVCLGGDLLDMLSGTPRTQQVREIVPLLKELAEVSKCAKSKPWLRNNATSPLAPYLRFWRS